MLFKMLSTKLNINKLGKICNRNYLLIYRSAQTAAKTETELAVLPKEDPKISESTTGITVASVENYSPISQISVAIKAGSRYENGHNSGIVHCLRNCATLATKNHSAFSITRNLELKGAKLGVSSTREHLIYTLQCVRDDVDFGLELLADVVTQPAFKEWEVSTAAPKMHVELALHDTDPAAVLSEHLHKAAFRGGLSNSLYSVPFMIGKHNSEMLKGFVEDNFTASRTAVVGLGVGHDHLQEAVTKLFNLNFYSQTDAASKYAGGEIRVEADVPVTHAAIVAEGAGLQNVKDVLSLGVLQCILGVGAPGKLSSLKNTKLGEAAAKCTNNPFTVSALNINYSDTGLFGVYVAGDPGDMKQLVKAIVSQMRDVTKNITESSVQHAKHKLKAKLHLERETSKDLLSAMVVEASHFGQLRDIKDIDKSIDDLKTSDITSIAAKVMKIKPAMAAVGRLHSTPHLDELI